MVIFHTGRQGPLLLGDAYDSHTEQTTAIWRSRATGGKAAKVL